MNLLITLLLFAAAQQPPEIIRHAVAHGCADCAASLAIPLDQILVSGGTTKCNNCGGKAETILINDLPAQGAHVKSEHADSVMLEVDGKKVYEVSTQSGGKPDAISGTLTGFEIANLVREAYACGGIEANLTISEVVSKNLVPKLKQMYDSLECAKLAKLIGEKEAKR